LSQANIARNVPERYVAETVNAISGPTRHASRAARPEGAAIQHPAS